MPGLEFVDLNSGAVSLTVVDVAVDSSSKMGGWGAPHSSGSVARVLLFLLFTRPPPPLSLNSHTQSSLSSSSAASAPPLSSIPWLVLFF